MTHYYRRVGAWEPGYPEVPSVYTVDNLDLGSVLTCNILLIPYHSQRYAKISGSFIYNVSHRYDTDIHIHMHARCIHINIVYIPTGQNRLQE